MNSEELEQSLRTEFESYLKDVLAEMKQEVADFQTTFQSELEKHKTQLDTVFSNFSSKIENDRQLDAPFKDSIVEHLRLARDEGASITATAIAEAEAMQRETDAQAAPPAANYSEIRDAVQDITEKDSQSAILKALVNHAGQFTPRGAFFIIKNEHFVGWRVFGEEGETDEQTVREIFFPINSDTILGESVRSLSAVESSDGTYNEDSLFLNKLEFGNPEKMIAIPLVARNRGVAVLYADYGTKGGQINVEALETLVRVAGLTVELLAASSQAVKSPKTDSLAASTDEREHQIAAPHQTPAVNGYEKTADENYAAPVQAEMTENTPAFGNLANDYQFQTGTQDFDYIAKDEFQPTAEKSALEYEEITPDAQSPVEKPAEFSWNQPSYDSHKQAEIVETPPFSTTENETAAVRDFSFEPSSEIADYAPELSSAPQIVENFDVQPHDFSAEMPTAKVEPESYQAAEFQTPQFESTYQNWNSGAAQETQFETPSFEPATETYQENTAKSFDQPNTTYQELPTAEVEKPAETPAPPKSRLSERNVDLPIEVPEEERRSHNDARRFARLLVSEIKLYNEQKVKEGREMNDLYERLREAIDRSREMYDKRVQSPVAAKFDYFHYELINNLAEGSESKLGTSYKGATV